MFAHQASPKKAFKLNLYTAAFFTVLLLLLWIVPCQVGKAVDYQMPPKAIADLIDAPPTPDVQRDPNKEWMLILEKPKAINLFSFKNNAKANTIIVCKPHKGAMPINTPSAIDFAFFAEESELLTTFSMKNFLIPFFSILLNKWSSECICA